MGLKDYKLYQKRKELENFFLEFGITKEDLSYLHEALDIIKNRKEEKPVVAKTLSDKDKEAIRKSQEGKMTPEQLIEAFAGEVEEFYPNGKAPKHN